MSTIFRPLVDFFRHTKPLGNFRRFYNQRKRTSPHQENPAPCRKFSPQYSELYNGKQVFSHFHFRRGRYTTYNAIDGTIRVGRCGKPYKVAPMPVLRGKTAFTPVVCR